jgi:hypothetical protein
MKTKIILLFLFIYSVQLKGQYNNKNLILASESTAAKFTYGNMRVYPLYANDEFLKKNSGSHKYLSLKDAIEKKKLKVTEKNSSNESAEVNSLTVQNLSKDTIMLLGGEIIEGGKQDRMIASDVILLPNSTNNNLKVFCVEHGRWTTKGSGKGSLGFSNCTATPVASPTIRKAGTVTYNQAYVWKEVEQVTDKNEVKTSTSAYTALRTDSTYQNKVSGYQKFFTNILKSNSKIIGTIYVTGSRVMGCDMFESHDLFMKHADNLISSYSTEAISNGKSVSIPYATVQKYANNILADESKQDMNIKNNGTILKNNGNKIHIATY